MWPVVAESAMVGSGEPQATDVGVEILRQGGNAFDAAVAVGFALAVTHPIAGNLGGGGFCVALPAEGEPFALDFREVAPQAAHRDLFLDAKGDVVPGASTWSYRAVGVPGSVDGLLRLHEMGGLLSRAQILRPAIRLAQEGFPCSAFLENALREKREYLEPHQSTREVFFRDGRPLEFGEVVRQRALAETLREILRKGRSGFYEGRVARALAATMEANNGIMTLDDLSAYRSKKKEVLRIEVGEYELLTHPLPSSGGVTLAQAFGFLDLEELRQEGFQSAEYVRLLVEAERLAFADRNHHLGDPDFVEVPVEELVSRSYLEKRARLLPRRGIGRSDRVAPGAPLGKEQRPRVRRSRDSRDDSFVEPGETTHFCVADSQGNVIAITTTLNAWFGMGAIVPEGGFFLNNEMDDFSSKPGVANLYGLTGTEANAIAPGKRMLSSMTPTIVRRGDEFAFTVGSPGGSTIITTVLQVFLNMTLFDMNIREAIDAPRFHHQWLPDLVYREVDTFSPETRKRLGKMGYEVVERTSIGRATGIARDDRGRLHGYPDRRSAGKASGL